MPGRRRGDCGRNARGGSAPSGVAHGRCAQPIGGDHCRRSGCGGGSGGARRGKAVELIDLTRQQGAHPRIGAADVIPFVCVLISGIKLEQCALLARQAGLEIWCCFGGAVFFYEAAAARGRSLDEVRQFEGLERSSAKGIVAVPTWEGPGCIRRRSGGCAKIPCG